tara:strand:+ start:6629 stop:7687 length:1059 start_codon:yes stop_codon:yes gene_type:complete
MTGKEDGDPHWSLYLLDTYILYNMLYLAIIIGFSALDPRKRGEWLWYKISPFNIIDYTRYKEHKNWWANEAAKNRVAVEGEEAAKAQAGGGNTKYSLRIWTIVLLFSIFLFIMAILFPSKTKENFSNVTMPSMFKDSILDTGMSDSDKLGFLFRHIWSDSTNDKYTVQPHEVDDIKFIRSTDSEFEKSNNALQNYSITFKKEGFTNLKTVCGSSNDSTKLLDIQDQYRCKEGMNMKGEFCHNKSKSPCCQRYCPSDSGYGTYHAGNDQGGHITTLNRAPNNITAPDWQCNTESKWDKNTKQCMHVIARTQTEPVYLPVMPDGIGGEGGRGGDAGEGTPQISMGGNLTGDVEV